MDYGGEIRTLQLTEDMTMLLQWAHDRHPSSPLLFMHPGTQKPFTPLMVRRMHDEIIREAGLDHIRFEDLRHTCAVNALQNGMEVRELSQILGHARAALTQQNYGAYVGQPVPTPAEAKYEEPELDELMEASAQMENQMGL